MRILILFFSVAAMFLAGCESLSNPTDLPYDEFIVVRGVLTAGRVIDSIEIERTLPLTAQLSGNGYERDPQSFLPDAKVNMSFHGMQVGLRYNGNGYFTSDTIIAQPGETYSLDVVADGKHANAQTTIPHYVTVDSMGIAFDTSATSSLVTLSLAFTHDPYVPYTYYAITEDSLGGQFYSIWECVLDTAAAHATKAEITNAFFYNAKDSASLYKRLAKTKIGVITFDRAYYEYYRTSHFAFYSDGSDLPFSSSTHSSTIIWNVHGEGFGMFVGRAITLIPLR